MNDSTKTIVKYVLVGITITVLSIITELALEQSEAGHRTESLTYELLQGQLSSFNPNEPLPVVVVDICQLRGGKDDATSRES